MHETATVDEFFAEVCNDHTECVPFEIRTPKGLKVVYVEELEAGAVERWRADVAKARQSSDGEFDVHAQARLIIRCVTDGKGKRIFNDSHLSLLTSGRAKYVLPLAELCAHVNGIGRDASEHLKKNSETPQASDSQSASVVTLAG